jgi:hypothetical protein
MPPEPRSVPLSAEDLSFWYSDQPRQRTTMAMLLLVDRRPDPERLIAVATRMVEAVPRLRQRVVDAPFDLALPRWENDPTFDLDFHLRRYSLAAGSDGPGGLDELFRTLGPIYERPFDRTRPLWELIEIERPEGGAAMFFRLHHAVADGVGGNAILAALTDASREGEAPGPSRGSPAPSPAPSPTASARTPGGRAPSRAHSGARPATRAPCCAPDESRGRCSPISASAASRRCATSAARGASRASRSPSSPCARRSEPSAGA